MGLVDSGYRVVINCGARRVRAYFIFTYICFLGANLVGPPVEAVMRCERGERDG